MKLDSGYSDLNGESSKCSTKTFGRYLHPTRQYISPQNKYGLTPFALVILFRVAPSWSAIVLWKQYWTAEFMPLTSHLLALDIFIPVFISVPNRSIGGFSGGHGLIVYP